jgi:NAD(P)-dependent dehydrogenase (short-subunit alcohol dehydrogenase family)
MPVGARWGIGGAIAQKFAREGFFVVLTTHKQLNATPLADAIREQTVNAGSWSWISFRWIRYPLKISRIPKREQSIHIGGSARSEFVAPAWLGRFTQNVRQVVMKLRHAAALFSFGLALFY